VTAISVDTLERSEHLRETRGYRFPILSDGKDEVIRRWDLVHPRGGEDGTDIARPGEFWIDSSGKVRWVNLTEDCRVRATATRAGRIRRDEFGTRFDSLSRSVRCAWA
jgi:peroxiredoxin